MVFGVLLFAAGCAGSIALIFVPDFDRHDTTRWIWVTCAAIYALFAALCISVLRKLDDTVEISDEGIVWRRRHKPDVELRWNEITTVDDYLQARCLKLRSIDGRMIRIEYQFKDFEHLPPLLEQNLKDIETSPGQHTFRKHGSFYAAHLFVLTLFGGLAAWSLLNGLLVGAVMLLPTLPSLKALFVDRNLVVVEHERVLLRSVFGRREIEYSNLRDTRLGLAPQLLTLSMQERRAGKELKLAGFKNTFHLSQLVRRHHEKFLDGTTPRF